MQHTAWSRLKGCISEYKSDIIIQNSSRTNIWPGTNSTLYQMGSNANLMMLQNVSENSLEDNELMDHVQLKHVPAPEQLWALRWEWNTQEVLKCYLWQRKIKSKKTWQHSECHFRFLIFRPFRVLHNCTVVSQGSCELHPSLSARSITYCDITLIPKIIFQPSLGFDHAVVLCESSTSKGWSSPSPAHGDPISMWNT